MTARGPNECNLCGARIIWARMASGKAMPVDQHPAADGTVAVHRDVNGRTIGRVITADDPAESWERLHVTHFASCTVHREREQARAAVKAAQRQTPGVVVAADFTAPRPNDGPRGRRERRRGR
jgi:hypothetical protein